MGRLKDARRKRAAKRAAQREGKKSLKTLLDAREAVDKVIAEQREALSRDDLTDNERERRADRLDELVARRRRLSEKIIAERKSLATLRRQIRALGKRITHIRNRIKLRENYASPHFRYSEFDCNDGTPVPKAAYPALRALCKDVLEPLRKKYGAVHVNSGYRHAAYNASIGGASNSIHIYDRHPDAVAADHTCSGASPSTVANYEEDKADGLGRYATFTHADNRNRIGWPDARWSG